MRTTSDEGKHVDRCRGSLVGGVGSGSPGGDTPTERCRREWRPAGRAVTRLRDARGGVALVRRHPSAADCPGGA
jgi:hypothetical protein